MVVSLRHGSLKFRIQWLLKDAVVYGTLGVLARMFGVLIVPLTARALHLDEFAVADSLIILNEIVVALALLGLNQAVARVITETDDQIEKASVVGQGLAAALLFSAGCCLLLAVLTAPMLRFYLDVDDSRHAPAYWLMLGCVPCAVILHFAKMLLKWNFRRTQFVILAIVETVGCGTFTLMFVLGTEGGVAGVFAGRLLGMVAAAMLSVVFCRHFVLLSLSTDRLRQMLAFGTPLMVVGFLHQLMPVCERMVISRMLGLDPLALYAMGQRFARLITFLTSGFEMAWLPFAYSIYREDDAPKTYNRVLVLYCLFVGFACTAFVGIARPALVMYASEKYLHALDLIVPLIFALFIESIASITGVGVALAKRTHLSIISYLLHLAITVGAMLYLMHPWSLVGVAYAVLLGKIVRTAGETLIAHWAYPLHFRVVVPAQIVAVAFGVALFLQRPV